MTGRDGDSVEFEVEYWQQVLAGVSDVNDSILAASEAVGVIAAHVTILRAFGPSIIEGDPHLEEQYRAIERIMDAATEAMAEQRAVLGSIVKLVRGRADALGGELEARRAEVDS